MSVALEQKGYHVVDDLLGEELCATMRREAEEMHRRQKFELSYSEVAETGKKIWRDNVYAAEFDRDSWMLAPRLITYTSEVRLFQTCYCSFVITVHFPELCRTSGDEVLTRSIGDTFPITTSQSECAWS